MPRILHYVNQFFAGIGGEDKASTPPDVREGPVGPGVLLSGVVATLVCGDDYASEHPEELAELARRLVAERDIELVVAGPAFNSGRYGMACGTVCAAAPVPAVTGMHPDNPAVDAFKSRVYIVPVGVSAASMRPAMEAVARFGLKLATGEEIGPAAEEGYFPRGFRRNVWREERAAKRAVDLLMAKVSGQPWRSEIEITAYDHVKPAPPAPAGARIALATEGGLVPAGNPDGLEATRCTSWTAYELQRLMTEAFVSVHGGYDSQWVNADPNRMVPFDAARELLGERLAPDFYSTVGCGLPVTSAEQFGAEIAARAKQAGIQAIILSAT